MQDTVINGIRQLQDQDSAPRVFRLYPSAKIEFNFLNFKRSLAIKAMEQGQQDCDKFVKNAVEHLVDGQLAERPEGIIKQFRPIWDPSRS